MISSFTEKRVRSLILFVAGLVFLYHFAYQDPDKLNPYFTLLISACLFGPSVLNAFRGKDRNGD